MLSNRKFFIQAFKFFDLVTVAFGFVSTLLILSNFPLASILSLQLRISHLFLFGFLMYFWHIIFVLFNLHTSKRIGNIYQEFKDILKCTSLGSLAMLIAGFVFRIELLNGTSISLFWLNISLLMISGRIVLRYSLAFLRKRGINQKNVIIVGVGERALKFADMISSRKDLGYKILGFVDGKKYARKMSVKWPLMGDLGDMPGLLSNNIVDEVILCLPIKSNYDKIEEIVALCNEQGILVRVLADFFMSLLAKSQLTFIDEKMLFTVHFAPHEDPRILIKKAFDFIGAAVLLVLFSPVFLVAPILIKLTSPGPVFFFQERVGYNKRMFKIIKFRTMVENAEALLPSLEHLNETDGANFKIKDDPRITKVGKSLRKTSIDELPQLINILKGDMSLVGPRPLSVRDYKGQNANWQKRRFSMKPGLTCFWQVNGRNEIGFSKWMEMDMEYIARWSLWLDFKILWKTIPIVLQRKGAM